MTRDVVKGKVTRINEYYIVPSPEQTCYVSTKQLLLGSIYGDTISRRSSTKSLLHLMVSSECT